MLLGLEFTDAVAVGISAFLAPPALFISGLVFFAGSICSGAFESTSRGSIGGFLSKLTSGVIEESGQSSFQSILKKFRVSGAFKSEEVFAGEEVNIWF